MLCIYISLEEEPVPCPKAASLFILTVPPLSPHPLPSLNNICLSLPLELREAMEAEGSLFPANKKQGDTERLLCTGASQDPARYHFDPISLFVLRAQDSNPYIRADRDCGLCPGVAHGPHGHRGGHCPHPPSPVLRCCLQTSKGHESWPERWEGKDQI